MAALNIWNLIVEIVNPAQDTQEEFYERDNSREQTLSEASFQMMNRRF